MSTFSVQSKVLSIINNPYGLELLVQDVGMDANEKLHVFLSNKKRNYHESEAVLREALKSSQALLLTMKIVCSPSATVENKYFTNIYLQSVSVLLNASLPPTSAAHFYQDVIVPAVASSNNISGDTKKATLGPVLDNDVPF